MNTKSALEILDEHVAVASRPVVGLFADDPALMDTVCEAAMTARERDALRRPSGWRPSR